MPKSDRMTQLVRHDVATDAGKAQWRALKVTDSDETFVSLLEGLAKETKAPSDSAITKSPSVCMKPDGGPTNALCPSSSLTQSRKFASRQDLAYKPNRSQPETATHLGELLIPEIDRVVHQLISRISFPSQDHNGRYFVPTVGSIRKQCCRPGSLSTTQEQEQKKPMTPQLVFLYWPGVHLYQARCPFFKSATVGKWGRVFQS